MIDVFDIAINYATSILNPVYKIKSPLKCS